MFNLYALLPSYAENYLNTIENVCLEERVAAYDRFSNLPLPSIVEHEDGNNEATILITGPLSAAGPSPIARYYGFDGTGYIDIIAAAKKLNNDPGIEKVRLKIHSPGGTVDGMDQAWQALSELAKNKIVIAENHGTVASGAYYLATAASEIVAMSPLVETGSIGVIKAGFDFTEALSRAGIKEVRIISTNAPDKNADPNTVSGQQVHQKEVDAIERVFLQKISDSRGISVDDIIKNFGKGAMLIAQDPDSKIQDAIKVNMLDRLAIDEGSPPGVESQENNSTNTLKSGTIEKTDSIFEKNVTKGIDMDLEKLQAEHPTVYAQALSAGVAKGILQERDRVTAHLVMAEACGDMKLAVTCINDGVEHGPTVTAKYTAANMNRTAVTARGAEGEPPINTPTGDGKVDDKELAEATAKLLGVE